MPELGTAVLYLVLGVAAYTFAVSLAAAKRPHLLGAARLGAYAVVALVALDVLILAYCFVTHDFRVRYVHRYSDRSMPLSFLFTALWGGQDGSLLWWAFLLSAYTAACVKWLEGRYQQLQPYVLATIMVVFLFFGLLMSFAANPFETYWSGAPPDGRGLNPQLQNFYMIIHPPSLYTGFIGCTIPFAFAVAALATGRLDEEWIHASRGWTLFAWLFLSIGNLLGALWAYEELGWGGYWAWDPVENAAWMPWLTATAFVHSVMIQERRGMLKVWNVFLVFLTFMLTIFGTFLTRSGVIASVHSFAQSGIGVFFVWFLAAVAMGAIALVAWRWKGLQAKTSLDSVLSREAAFTFNNWILLSGLLVVLTLTTFPLLSEAFTGEKVTVGPTFFTFFMIPIAIVLVLLTGIGAVIPWRRGATKSFVRALVAPGGFALIVAAAFVVFGRRIGFPPYVEILPDVIDGVRAAWLRGLLRVAYGTVPTVTIFSCAFALGVVVQEFHRGARLRHRDRKESWPVALWQLVAANRRRYGGYTVHVGILLMLFGFLGSAYKQEREGALRPGQSLRVWDYRLTYARTEFDVDPAKRMVFARMHVTRAGESIGDLRPAKWVYRTQPDNPTTEVAIRPSLRDDLYVVLANVNPVEGVAMVKVYLNPLTSWIWIGGVVLIFGTFLTMFPALAKERIGVRRTVALGKPAAAGTAAAVLLALVLAPSHAIADQEMNGSNAPLPAGAIQLRSDVERHLFPRLLCMCGDCARLPLDTCTCGHAEDTRAEIRAELAAGKKPDRIMDEYRRRYGAAALAIPQARGFGRIAWVVPYVGIGLGVVGLTMLVRKWVRRSREVAAVADEKPRRLPPADEKVYEAALDAELRKLDG
jgi:cytochrome c-type biogenesis protein CcmF